MALGSYGTALGWLGSETGKSIIRVLFDYNQLCTSKLDIGKSEWLHLWTGSIHNITVQGNYVDTNVSENHGTNCPMIDNIVFPVGQPPAAAVAIMNASGVGTGNPWAAAVAAAAAGHA